MNINWIMLTAMGGYVSRGFNDLPGIQHDISTISFASRIKWRCCRGRFGPRWFYKASYRTPTAPHDLVLQFSAEMAVLPRTIRASMVLQGLVSYPDIAPWPGASIFCWKWQHSQTQKRSVSSASKYWKMQTKNQQWFGTVFVFLCCARRRRSCEDFRILASLLRAILSKVAKWTLINAITPDGGGIFSLHQVGNRIQCSTVMLRGKFLAISRISPWSCCCLIIVGQDCPNLHDWFAMVCMVWTSRTNGKPKYTNSQPMCHLNISHPNQFSKQQTSMQTNSLSSKLACKLMLNQC